MYRRILMGSDGSPESHRAATMVIGLARALGAEVTVAAVATEHPAALMPWAIQATEKAIPHDVAYGWAHEEVTWLAEQGLDADWVVLDGPPAEALAKYATTGAYDLVVVGHRGRDHGFAPGTGSVAAQLQDLLACPLLIVP